MSLHRGTRTGDFGPNGHAEAAHAVFQILLHDVERDWGKFHTVKNLAMAVAEDGELVAELQWHSDDRSVSRRPRGDPKYLPVMADSFDELRDRLRESRRRA